MFKTITALYVEDEADLREIVLNIANMIFKKVYVGVNGEDGLDLFMEHKDEIERAKKIVNAFIEAEKQGLGVVSLGTKMIDPPVVKRAQQTIDLAESLELIPKNWREEYE